MIFSLHDSQPTPLKHVPSTSNATPSTTSTLLEIARTIFSADYRVNTDSFRQGSYNLVHFLELCPDNIDTNLRRAIPSKIVVRIARREAKVNSDISVESEVATMVYVKRYTQVPVPTIFAYSPDSNNPVGLPFIIMSCCEGITLLKAEPILSPDARLRTIRDYAKFVSEFSKLKFDRIGSLYFGQRPGSFEVGPISRPKGCTTERRKLPVYDRGPWKSATSWLEASVKDEIQLLELRPDLLEAAVGAKVLDKDDILPVSRRVLPQLLWRIPEVIGDDHGAHSAFVLAHMDLNITNIMVSTSGSDAGKITGFVDWEFSCTTPLWYLAPFPEWFEKPTIWGDRDPQEAQAFKETYLAELKKLGHDSAFIQIARTDGRKKECARTCTLGRWFDVEDIEDWLNKVV